VALFFPTRLRQMQPQAIDITRKTDTAPRDLGQTKI
jgi:hypothetical protein